MYLKNLAVAEKATILAYLDTKTPHQIARTIQLMAQKIVELQEKATCASWAQDREYQTDNYGQYTGYSRQR